MSLPVIIRPAAVADIDAGKDWYTQKSDRIGKRFAAAVVAALDGIAEQPELYAPIWRNVRWRKLRRFPYVVYYRLLTDRIEVIAVIRGSRHSRQWRSRA